MLPLKRLKGKTPAELWTGKKPNVEMLRIYGSKAYVHINEQFRSKFESKSKQMILVGYEPKRKAYRLWLPGSNKVEISRDVIIVEPKTKQQAVLVPTDVNELNKYKEKPPTEESTIIEDNEPIAHRTRKQIKEAQLEQFISDRTQSKVSSHLAINSVAFIANVTIPQTVEEARSLPDKEQWEQSMATELKALEKNNTYTLVEPPQDCKLIKNR